MSQELMNFAAEEYDARASLHVTQPAIQPSQRIQIAHLREAQPHLKFEFNVIKCIGC
jgi:hypothetical protein